jgi:hypothetical protein
VANLSLRGLDGATLARIRSSARRLKVSVNRLIVETLRLHYAPGPRPRDQIDELAGTWSAQEAREFAAAIKPFSEIDPALWASEPQAAYRVRAGGKRGRVRRRA